MNVHYLNVKINEAQSGRTVREICRHDLKLSAGKLSSVKYDPHGILLNGSRVNVSAMVKTGDTLSILLNDSENRTDHLIPAPMQLKILYEDADIIIIDKPSGAVCHPSAGHCTDSLANGLLYYFKSKNERSSIHLVGRLDKDTSGVLTIAKNSVTADILAEERSAGEFYKTYYCLVSGLMKEASGEINIPMEEYRDADGFIKMRRGSSPAVTRYKVIREYANYSLLQVHIDTGRTHQIRFAMAETGHPLIGDSLYGSVSEFISHTALHAGCVHFTHPFTKKMIDIESPFPKDFKCLIKKQEVS